MLFQVLWAALSRLSGTSSGGGVPANALLDMADDAITDMAGNYITDMGA